MNIPAKIGEILRCQLGQEYDELLSVASKPERTSFRINPLKASDKDINSFFQAEPIPWCPGGFFTSGKVGDSLEHFLGVIYVQEAASMLAAIALEPKPGELVLDMCAAPGSKTTQIAAMMGNLGCIVANEIDRKRLKTLRFNMNRMGVVNAIISNNDGCRLKTKAQFDRILLDVPCSNLGQLRENPEVLGMWNSALAKSCSKIQKSLIDNACSMLKDGGTLVYSTCTFAVEENEEIVDYAVTEHGLTVEDITGAFACHDGLMEWDGRTFSSQVEKSARIYPHDNDTGGFFLAKMKK